MKRRSLSFFLFQSLSSFSALGWLEANTEQAWHRRSPALASNCVCVWCVCVVCGCGCVGGTHHYNRGRDKYYFLVYHLHVGNYLDKLSRQTTGWLTLCRSKSAMLVTMPSLRGATLSLSWEQNPLWKWMSSSRLGNSCSMSLAGKMPCFWRGILYI